MAKERKEANFGSRDSLWKNVFYQPLWESHGLLRRLFWQTVIVLTDCEDRSISVLNTSSPKPSSLDLAVKGWPCLHSFLLLHSLSLGYLISFHIFMQMTPKLLWSQPLTKTLGIVHLINWCDISPGSIAFEHSFCKLFNSNLSLTFLIYKPRDWINGFLWPLSATAFYDFMEIYRQLDTQSRERD